jgi:hypothetical protein
MMTYCNMVTMGLKSLKILINLKVLTIDSIITEIMMTLEISTNGSRIK